MRGSIKQALSWLARTAAADSPTLQSHLIDLLVGKTISSSLGVALVVGLAAVAWFRTDASWAILWGAANCVLLATQINHYRLFRIARQSGQRLPVSRIIANGLSWALVVGAGLFACASTGDVSLAAIAGMNTAVICAGLAARTSNMPRYAAAQILIASVCFFAGLLHSQVAELRLMAGQTVIGTIALVFLVRQHSAALVATIRLATENRFLASHDPLTGLANRMQLHERIGFLLGTHGKAHRAGDRDFSLLYIDLDGFKSVNDAHGHAVGDRLLKAVADRLLALMRSVDLVARIGGDEFMVILAGTDLQQVAGTAERLIAALSLPYELQDDLQVSIGASIGSITADRDTVSADALIAQAGHGMYAAKRAGGGVHRRGV